MKKRYGFFSSLTAFAAIFRRLFFGLGFVAVGIVLSLSDNTVAQVVQTEELFSVGFGRCQYRVTYEYRLRTGGQRQESRLEEGQCEQPPYPVGAQVSLSYHLHSGKISMVGIPFGGNLPVTAVFALILGGGILIWPFLQGYLMRVVALLKVKWRRPHY